MWRITPPQFMMILLILLFHSNLYKEIEIDSTLSKRCRCESCWRKRHTTTSWESSQRTRKTFVYLCLQYMQRIIYSTVVSLHNSWYYYYIQSITSMTFWYVLYNIPSSYSNICLSSHQSRRRNICMPYTSFWNYSGNKSALVKSVGDLLLAWQLIGYGSSSKHDCETMGWWKSIGLGSKQSFWRDPIFPWTLTVKGKIHISWPKMIASTMNTSHCVLQR